MEKIEKKRTTYVLTTELHIKKEDLREHAWREREEEGRKKEGKDEGRVKGKGVSGGGVTTPAPPFESTPSFFSPYQKAIIW